MGVEFQASQPKNIELASHFSASERRSTFRQAVTNVLRPRMYRLMEEVKDKTLYTDPAILNAYKVEQSTTGEQVSVALVNRHRAAKYLLGRGGSKAHLIVQEPHAIPLGNYPESNTGGLSNWAGLVVRDYTPRSVFMAARKVQVILTMKDIEINHPGTPEDTEALDAIDAAREDGLQALSAGVTRWAEDFGVGGAASQPAPTGFGTRYARGGR